MDFHLGSSATNSKSKTIPKRIFLCKMWAPDSTDRCVIYRWNECSYEQKFKLKMIKWMELSPTCSLEIKPYYKFVAVVLDHNNSKNRALRKKTKN